MTAAAMKIGVGMGHPGMKFPKYFDLVVAQDQADGSCAGVEDQRCDHGLNLELCNECAVHAAAEECKNKAEQDADAHRDSQLVDGVVAVARQHHAGAAGRQAHDRADGDIGSCGDRNDQGLPDSEDRDLAAAV